MSQARIGLALGSGSARGWSHIGIIDVLTEAGLVPDIVCGSSIGSLVGAAYVTGRFDALKSWVEKITWRDVLALMDVRLASGGLIDGAFVVDLLEKLGITNPIETVSIPYAAVATDLDSGREVWLRQGPIHHAVRASISLPGIFSPARRDGRFMVDGGLTNPVPVSVCRAMGADVIIAVNLNGELLGRRFFDKPPDRTKHAGISKDFVDRVLSPLPAVLRTQAKEIIPKLLPQQKGAPSYFDVLANSINVMQDQITRSRLAGDPPHVMLVPRLADMGLLDYNRAEEAIEEGRVTARASLDAIKRLVNA